VYSGFGLEHEDSNHEHRADNAVLDFTQTTQHILSNAITQYNNNNNNNNNTNMIFAALLSTAKPL